MRIIPSFRGVSTPAYVWIKDETVSQELPAATNGGATYSIKETLPGGLTFTPTTRTIFGTHGTTQAVANYTLVTTDADKVALRFSIRIDDVTILISSPSVAEGAGGAMAAWTLTEAASQATLVLTPLTIRRKRHPHRGHGDRHRGQQHHVRWQQARYRSHNHSGVTAPAAVTLTITNDEMAALGNLPMSG